MAHQLDANLVFEIADLADVLMPGKVRTRIPR
jgi:hypothetical protein